jgi:transcriptional regulator with XRE-family HTH domain
MDNGTRGDFPRKPDSTNSVPDAPHVANFKQTVRKNGLTLTTMAERAGSTAASISRIEHGKQLPSWRLVRRLGAITGLAPEIFLDRLLCDPASDDGAAPAA